MSQDKNEEKAEPNDYENHSPRPTCRVTPTATDGADSNGPTKYDISKNSFSYQPALAVFGNTMNYKNANSGNANSSGVLPDDYLKCTEMDPKQTLSAAWFTGSDDSNDTIIDLNKFLVQADAHSPPPSLSEYSQQVPPLGSCSHEKDEKLTSDEETEVVGLLEDSSGEERSQHTSGTTNYTKVSDYINRTDCEPSDDELTRMNSQEDNSGDSGYVGRNLIIGLRTDSLSSSDIDSANYSKVGTAR